ncbi:membrane-bound hydrogenase subunit ehbL [Methanobrevibacter gottschalkii]|uniref:Membrane-bound hydrogenase subunit ehbL n=2 Tax=Methanobrevibacter gottschalkii TaxID=190974 RepID=A0A3N5B4S7_9EURY|nr:MULTISPECIES: 4Fe-4S binding protein [Methanobrevibacter]MCQ2970184.1 4Fe-4S binding protein [archaeon]OEC93829.1 energy-converting hydrogenase B subunit L EhbL [Methanobrevibacter sp. A27]RPF52666.1 membrane-bound hydrogenase subunit ehbL [Methanobrevibacter gottschalkii DSM 11977]SEK28587.1 membrane-bound hydrogenase subunit ehbL [Methanobrevibacter gottschalkii]
MRNLIKIALEGAFTNFKRIFFAADRVTDMDMKKQIATLSVEVDDRVDESACIGCSGCANVCPTNAIVMKPLAHPVKLTEGWVKDQVPEIILEKCVVCYYCHDFCPIFSLYGQKGAIHPSCVGDQEVDVSEFLEQPFKISDDKLKIIAQYLSDKTVLKNKEDGD